MSGTRRRSSTPAPATSGSSDERFYHQQARLVADGHGFLNPFGYYAPVGSAAHRVFETAVHPPAYTVFLAIPARLGIDSVLSQRIITALLGAGTVFLLGFLGRRLGGGPSAAEQARGERIGLIAAVLAAVSPALWVNDSVLGLETLYGFLVVVGLLFVYRFWSAPRMGSAIGIAAALALAALTRSEGILLLVLVALPTVLLAPGIAWKHRFRFLGVMALVVRRHHRPVGRPQPHDVRRADDARDRIRRGAGLR